jgi:Ca2+/Na+ antiporter
MEFDRHRLNNLGYISITVMMLMLLLLWFKLVPQWLTLPFFLVALALVVVRIVLRVKLIQKERQESQSTTRLNS